MDQPRTRSAIADLPVELFVYTLSLVVGFSAGDASRLLPVSRRVHDVILGTPSLWTRVAFVLQADALTSILAGIDQALENSATLPLTLVFSVTALPSVVVLNQVVRRVFSSGSRWRIMRITFIGECNMSHPQSWILGLWTLTEVAGGASPFTRMEELNMDPTDACVHQLGRLTPYNVEHLHFPRLFPNLRKLRLVNASFQNACKLGAQLAITSLEELELVGIFWQASTFLVRDILEKVPGLRVLKFKAREVNYRVVPSQVGDSPLAITLHACLERLTLGGPQDFLKNQLRSLNCPSLIGLVLKWKPSRNTSANPPEPFDLVGEVLEMVSRSRCRLASLRLEKFALSNDDLVRLFVELPHLRTIYLILRDGGGANGGFLADLLVRSNSEPILPRLERLSVSTIPERAGGTPYTFPSNGFVDFVQDERRSGQGPFARLRKATLAFQPAGVVFSQVRP
ncbi:hypothetical protein CC1G_08242 [Coprinopsis cinerea okayama7|uniref:F-box domain-containing protein n=1 Tax=Coprinopsis cinerea (strain Okayama-7 / 130 / ATCC MYA-4618 / FGSC 9003) TaxID=240176 RepID=A8P7J6_COPC7|nr:hypothetical protein CC1G_08242 [Coprinopsis cinerea okayama7\|eukprot:XP_001839375.2 hypothetical protein CC1G_08242 [Coprinopsis cinerea okayama7\